MKNNLQLKRKNPSNKLNIKIEKNFANAVDRFTKKNSEKNKQKLSYFKRELKK